MAVYCFNYPLGAGRPTGYIEHFQILSNEPPTHKEKYLFKFPYALGNTKKQKISHTIVLLPTSHKMHKICHSVCESIM